MALGYVRPAVPAEAGEIVEIQLTTWRVAYRRLLPASILDELDREFLTERWRSAIESPPTSRHRVLLAVEQGGQTQTVGFLAAGPADEEAAAPDEPTPPDPTTTVAITDLLVSPRWGRRGHGSRLLSAGVTHWRDDGFQTAVAWAFEEDPATRRFLISAGWEPDGLRRTLDVDDLLVPQLRLHTSLAPEQPEPDGPG
ncbi:GNAT family N-acetyltransferase [Natronosporangium hydrolyticum]|uniref:GNAT family N-acetyltransferase n=1 Tax=Natronosporangium hydrolyticum TaxID=2811111 RepID=A0A895Y6U9_9ACTN|nr:GNAT family N-acetyltransferase [Natronosporangium hydrolyticum]QSB13467.1 GNAT family N-acetyltransferase [Natronosporangium hydrolyticum]